MLAEVSIAAIVFLLIMSGSALASSSAFWYVARAAGLSAYLALFANIVLGLSVKTKFLDGVIARWQSFDLHQFTALVALGFVGLHVLALLGDQFVHFSPLQVLVPFAASYRPFWTGLGVFALYSMVAVTGSFYVKNRIGQKAWRSIHYLSFVTFVLVLFHGVFAGTDSTEPWAKLLYWSTGVVVAMLTTWRFLEAGSPAPARANGKVLAKVPVAGPRAR
jgi:predicted ferric reductase